MKTSTYKSFKAILLPFFILICCLSTTGIFAFHNALLLEADTIPVKKISGTITDTEGAPMSGVIIKLQDSELETSTGVAGNYELTVPEEATVLAISFPGYATSYVNVSDKSIVNLELSETLELDEEVAIGYGVVKRSTLTGSVASVTADQIATFPQATMRQSLHGRMAGVNFQTNQHTPRPSIATRIRGSVSNSLESSTGPLFVVDGFVGGLVPAIEDIASVEVLKDAGAASIYGSRAANGVVLITTKRGKEGRPKVQLNTSLSIAQPSKKIDLLNGDQFAEYQIASGRDSTRTGINTDWQDEIFQTGTIQNYQLSVAGGSESVNYYISGIYYDNLGILENSGYDRLSLMGNLDIKVNDWLTFGANFLGFREVNQLLKPRRPEEVMKKQV